MKTIAYITDIHLEEDFPKSLGADSKKNWEIILKDVASGNIHEIIFGGDIGEAASNEWFFNSLKKFKLQVTIGNHDTFSEAIKFFRSDHFHGGTELYYSYEDNFFKYLFMDSSLEEISDQQLTWLKNSLSTNKKILLFIHHPVLAINSMVDKLYPLKNRDAVKEELLKINNEVTIFCGHYHITQKNSEKNITQFITLSSSYQMLKNPTELVTSAAFFGYRIIKIDNDKLETEVINLSHHSGFS